MPCPMRAGAPPPAGLNAVAQYPEIHHGIIIHLNTIPSRTYACTFSSCSTTMWPSLTRGGHSEEVGGVQLTCHSDQHVAVPHISSADHFFNLTGNDTCSKCVQSTSPTDNRLAPASCNTNANYGVPIMLQKMDCPVPTLRGTPKQCHLITLTQPCTSIATQP